MREHVDNAIDQMIEELNSKRETLLIHADKIAKKIPKNAWFHKGELIYGFIPMGGVGGKVKVVSAIIADPGQIKLWTSNFKPSCSQNDIQVHVLGVEIKDAPPGFDTVFNHRQWPVDRAKAGDKIRIYSYNPRARLHAWKKQDWYDKYFKKEE
jgi:hypothetical protein